MPYPFLSSCPVLTSELTWPQSHQLIIDLVELEGATAAVWLREPSVFGGLQAGASRVGSGLSSSLAGKICWPCHSAKCPHPASQWASDRICLPHTAGCCWTFDPSGIVRASRLDRHTVNNRGFWISTAHPLPCTFIFCSMFWCYYGKYWCSRRKQDQKFTGLKQEVWNAERTVCTKLSNMLRLF